MDYSLVSYAWLTPREEDSDAKAANRNAKERGDRKCPCTMDESQTFAAYVYMRVRAGFLDMELTRRASCDLPSEIPHVAIRFFIAVRRLTGLAGARGVARGTHVRSRR